MHGDEEKCREAGCTGFLTKPIDMDLLVRTVGQAAGKTPIAQRLQIAGCCIAGADIDTRGGPCRRRCSGHRRTALPAMPQIPAHLISSLPQDDPEFCQIIVEFVDRLHEQLGAMQDAWGKHDLGELASLAHWLKGSGGTAGFAALTDPARKLEQLAREKNLEEIGNAIETLQQLAERIEVPAIEPAANAQPTRTLK